jgi:hypothetical protein
LDRLFVKSVEDFVMPRVRGFVRVCLLPFGYLAFVLALAALSVAARLLGEEHALGFFAGRLKEMITRYPEVTRRGVQMAWVCWSLLFVVAVTPLDPISSRWDEVLLAAVALGVIWQRLLGDHRVGR